MKLPPSLGSAVVVGLLALAGCQDSAPEKKGTPIVIDGSSLEFEPATVMRGSAGTGWGLGSYRVWILGRTDGRCVFEFFDEEEGGFASYLCQVPVEGPPVRIYEENGGIARTFDLEDAELLTRGNLLLGPGDEEPAPLKWEQRHVPNTDFMNRVVDLKERAGDEAGLEKRVTVHATVYSNEHMKTPLVGFESGQFFRFKLGDGTAGPGLESAVQGMRTGGIRLALIREEIGGALNSAFGPFNPGTLMAVKLELVKME